MKKEIKINFEYFNARHELTEEDEKLFQKALEARENAYAPYSRFYVGCVLLFENGETVVANNQENAAFPSGLCAERAAIFWAAANFPSQKIKKIMVTGAPQDENEKTPPTPPCGACRQSILEYETKQGKEIEIIFASLDGEAYKSNSVKDLLPFTFDGTYL